MRLVNSVLTLEPLNETEIHLIESALRNEYSLEIQVQSYKYEDRQYFETDFDIIDIVFTKESIYEDINRLIGVYTRIIPNAEKMLDVIIANDDTESEILQYEGNFNNVSGFGLFITGRTIPDIQPYYKSEICNAYLNFDNVSFDVMF